MAEPPAKRQRLNMTERFIVVVGREATEIPVITSIATRSSKFFQAAMGHDWKEAREKRVPLPETKVDVFEGYLQWIYTSQITFTGKSEHNAMAQFYILGDYLIDQKFCDAALDGIMSTFLEMNIWPGPYSIELAWSKTHHRSLLRQLIMEIWTTLSLSKAVDILLDPKSQAEQYPREFVVDYFKRFVSSSVREDERSRKQLMEDFKASTKDMADTAGEARS